MAIHFGTDGWRGVIGADFTFDNLARLGRAIVDTLSDRGDLASIVIGYDTRFMSRQFAYFLGDYLRNFVDTVCLFSQPCPTPVLSFYTRQRKASLGIMVTASHNPFYYNGVKFKMDFGGPPIDDFIERVEKAVPSGLIPYSLVVSQLFNDLSQDCRVEFIHNFDEYIENILKFLDKDLLQKFPGKVLYNAMNGSGQNMMPLLFKKLNMKAGLERCEMNPLFHEEQPEPISHLLQDFAVNVKESNYAMGIATDGDADRIGLFDEKGDFVDLFVITALLYQYLVEVKKLEGGVAYSASLIDIAGRIAGKHGYAAAEVPVGFKHVARKLHEPGYLLAAEESGGIGYGFHIPERDGILTALLLMEMMSYYKQPLSRLVSDFLDEWDKPHYGRIDFYAPSEILQLNFHRLQEKTPEKLGNLSIKKVKEIDGLKWYFKGGWVLMRISQTEPMGRIYVMASSQPEIREILALCRGLLTKK